MPRYILSLPFLTVFVTILAAIFGTPIWLREIVPADLGSRLFDANLQCAIERYKSTLSR